MKQETWTASELESSLGQLRSVANAKVVMDAPNSIKEIHALMNGERNPKQVVRDIESTLLARHGISIDHKAISIAQIDPTVTAIDRLRWLDVAMSQEGRKAKAAVTLAKNGRVFTGSADGQRSSFNTLRLVAQATVNAVEEALGQVDRFALQDLTLCEMLGGMKVVVVLVSLVGDASDQLLAGSAVVQQSDTSRAVAHATLDALNRRLMWLPVEPQTES